MVMGCLCIDEHPFQPIDLSLGYAAIGEAAHLYELWNQDLKPAPVLSGLRRRTKRGVRKALLFFMGVW